MCMADSTEQKAFCIDMHNWQTPALSQRLCIPVPVYGWAKNGLFWVQLDATLVERDWRWNCQRSFEMTLGEGLVELFFIDTNPAVQKYYDRPWANFTGMSPYLFLSLPLFNQSCQSACGLACTVSISIGNFYSHTEPHPPVDT